LPVRIYTKKEIDKIKASGEISFETHMYLKDLVEPGISTFELDKKATAFIRKKGGEPSFLGFNGFPACLCTSINDSVVHGVPKKADVLKEGDIIGIDLGVKYLGFHSDTACEAKKLIYVTQQCLFKGIKEAAVKNKIGAIGEAVQKHAEKNGYSVVRSLVGHGVGKTIHEEPQVPNYGKRKQGIRIKPGMVLAIEPMINIGVYDVYTDDDQWTIRTNDGKLSGHFEHTIAITANGPEICTMPKGAEINVFTLKGFEK